MAKISVRHSVAESYGLLFGRPLTVIGLTWLPAVFYAVAADFLIRKMNAAMALSVPVASGLLGEYAFFYFAALLVTTAFFGALIAVPLTRQAFGLREERVAAHLVVGAREFRLFFAFLRYYVLLATVLALFAIGAGVTITQGVHYATSHGVPAAWLGLPLETWLNSAAGALAVIIFAALTVRYGFFLDAIAAAEDHARLSRAAVLSRGNFWTIVTTLVIVGVPASLTLVACEMTFGGLSLARLGLSSAAATPFAGILAAGLVVLHTLSAGASAGAYAELADAAVVQEAEPARAPATVSPHAAPAEVYASVAPAEVYASAQQAAPELPPLPELPPELPPQTDLPPQTEFVPQAELPPQPEVQPTPEQSPTAAAEDASFQAEMTEAAQMAEPMEIVTQKTESASPLPAPPPGEWMAPPPDAHFGSDPHDALGQEPHDVQAHAPTQGEIQPLDPLPPAEPLPAVEPSASAIAATETPAHPVEAQNAAAEVHMASLGAAQDPSAVAIEVTPVPERLHPDAEDADDRVTHAVLSFDGQPEELPDHAHDTELPPPPLDPAGVLAAQSQAQLPPAA